MSLQNLKNKIEELNDSSSYTEAADLATNVFNLELKVVSHKVGSMSWDEDKQLRRIFTMCLIRDKESYTFDFGQSTPHDLQ